MPASRYSVTIVCILKYYNYLSNTQITTEYRVQRWIRDGKRDRRQYTSEYYVHLQNTLMKDTFDRRINLQQSDLSWLEYKTQFLQYSDEEHSKLLRNYYDILYDDDDDDENAVIQEEIIEVIEDGSIKADGGNGRTGQTLFDIAMLEKLSSLYS